MPKKSKKQKLSHVTSLDPSQPLNHNEIWDDSALIKSWNAAVAEYEYYHSLAAKGLDVEDVLDHAEEAEANDEDVDLALGDGDTNGALATGDGRHDEGVAEGGDVEDGEVEEEELPDAPVTGQAKVERRAPQSGPQMPTDVNLPQPEAANGGATATTLTQDQTLENVKMAYYWAGYYSGIYDAQRQGGNAPATADRQGSGG